MEWINSTILAHGGMESCGFTLAAENSPNKTGSLSSNVFGK
jgi:hypothetical protein